MKSILAFPKTTYKTRFQNDVLRHCFCNNRSLSSILNTPILVEQWVKVVLHKSAILSVVFFCIGCSMLCSLNSDSWVILFKASFKPKAPLASTLISTCSGVKCCLIYRNKSSSFQNLLLYLSFTQNPSANFLLFVAS
jgi:hypothetical protein